LHDVPYDFQTKGFSVSTISVLKKNIQTKRPVFGSWMQVPHPVVTETLAQTGLDFLLADGEHAPIPPHALLDILPSAEKYGTPVIYRVASNRTEYIKAALDFGAQGVMVPMVNSAEEAAAAVAAAKYPPTGTRGLGAWRASNYYQDHANYRATANDETIVVVQIETVEAVRCVDAIAAIPGIDVVYIGPGDLALSLGTKPGEFGAEMIGACKEVAAAAKRHGIASGIDVFQLEDIGEFIRFGMSFFTHGLTASYILNGGRETDRVMRTAFGRA
jgi:4-hydroxy-2-oxoheptanedioate aldolase